MVRRPPIRLPGFAASAPALAVGLASLLALASCSTSSVEPTGIGPPRPQPGQYYDCILGLQGPWLSLAENEVVNVSVREHVNFEGTERDPCGVRDTRTTDFYAVFRGRMVARDSAAGTLREIVGADKDITANGTFAAKWHDRKWWVTTDVTASDDCRTAPGSASFTACGEGPPSPVDTAAP